GRAEEMMADHLLRSRRGRGDLVDVQRRGVRGEDGIRPSGLVQLRKDLLFQGHSFKDSLYDYVCLAEAVVGQRRLDPGEALLHLLGRESAFADRGGVVLANDG